MNRHKIVFIFLTWVLGAGATGCGEVPPVSLEPDASVAEEGLASSSIPPFFAFDVGTHRIEMFEPSPGALLVTESAPTGTDSILEGLSDTASASDVYEALIDASAPEALVAYDVRVAALAEEELASEPDAEPVIASSETPALAGGQPKSAGTPAHFRANHCATEPDPLSEYSFYEDGPAQAVREFCWADGRSGAYTVTASARVMGGYLASVEGGICLTITNDEQTFSYNIADEGQRWYWWRNRVVKDCDCPPWPFACGVCDKTIVVDTMTAKVGCADGDTWRFGGGFWK